LTFAYCLLPYAFTLQKEAEMEEKVILLIEDNGDDAELTLRALKRNHISNEVVVARDGIEALDYLFGTGSFSGRDTGILPALNLMVLRCCAVSGLMNGQGFCPWSSLLHRRKSKTGSTVIKMAPIATFESRWTLISLPKP
jgi:hypothetical protein